MCGPLPGERPKDGPGKECCKTTGREKEESGEKGEKGGQKRHRNSAYQNLPGSWSRSTKENNRTRSREPLGNSLQAECGRAELVYFTIKSEPPEEGKVGGEEEGERGHPTRRHSHGKINRFGEGKLQKTWSKNRGQILKQSAKTKFNNKMCCRGARNRSAQKHVTALATIAKS